VVIKDNLQTLESISQRLDQEGASVGGTFGLGPVLLTEAILGYGAAFYLSHSFDPFIHFFPFSQLSFRMAARSEGRRRY
jgi:hypothetical protein